MFRLNAPVVIRVKVEEVQTHIAIYSHTLLKIHDIGGQRSVKIAPLSLPPHHSGPATQLKHSSAGVIWMCRAFFTNSSCPLPWSSMVVSSQWIRW